MKSLLQAVAWWADTVLTACYPEPERLPSLDQAAALADKEAQEDVAEPASDCCFSEADWLGNNNDPLDRLIALVEDIRNLMSSTVFAAGVAESPGEVEPPASPGQPNLTPDERDYASFACRYFARHHAGITGDQELYFTIADKISPGVLYGSSVQANNKGGKSVVE